MYFQPRKINLNKVQSFKRSVDEHVCTYSLLSLHIHRIAKTKKKESNPVKSSSSFFVSVFSQNSGKYAIVLADKLQQTEALISSAFSVRSFNTRTNFERKSS